MESFKTCAIIHIRDFHSKMDEYLSEIFNYEIKISYSYPHFKDLISQLKSDIYFFIEYPYFDKLYLDKYSAYYSTKFSETSRYVVRVHLFDTEIEDKDFQDIEKRTILNEHYLGNFILQPTKGSIIGQTFINPLAFHHKNTNHLCLLTETFTVSGVLLTTQGFYHTFQDVEVASCAYNSVWSFMNYYSNKSNEYIQLLPSQVNKILENTSGFTVRASNGLEVEQLSYILKKNQFETYLFNKGVYGEHRFKQILDCYIDSGFPVFAFYSSKDFSHVNLLIGKEMPQRHKLNIKKSSINYEHSNKIKFFDFSFYKSNYIAIDDNFLPYKQIDISEKNNPFGNDLILTSILVPLPNKVRLDAYQAFDISMLALKTVSDELKLFDLKYICTKLNLIKSEKLKVLINNNEAIESNLKTLLIDCHLPEYVWVLEISNEKLFPQNYSLGFVIVDATIEEYNSSYHLFYINGKLLVKDKGLYKIIEFDNLPFPLLTKLYL